MSKYETGQLLQYLADKKYINADATQALKLRIKKNALIDDIVGNDADFSVVALAFEQMCASDDVDFVDFKSAHLINTRVPHITLSFKTDIEGLTYDAVIFRSMVLIFVHAKGTRVEFLFALDAACISINARKVSKDVPVVVEEKTRNPIQYYDIYNPYPDSEILGRHWEKTNLDGSRSFAGGLKPENNPLHFTLEYGLIEVKVCEAVFEASFSNSKAVLYFAKLASSAFRGHLRGNKSSKYAIKSIIKSAIATVIAVIKKMCKRHSGSSCSKWVFWVFTILFLLFVMLRVIGFVVEVPFFASYG